MFKKVTLTLLTVTLLLGSALPYTINTEAKTYKKKIVKRKVVKKKTTSLNSSMQNKWNACKKNTLMIDMIATEWERAGLKNQVITAQKIACVESQFNCTVGSKYAGLYQINYRLHGFSEASTRDCRGNILNAISLYKKNSWRDWGSLTNAWGSYRYLKSMK